MSDLFHEDVPADYIARVGDVMRRADNQLIDRATPPSPITTLRRYGGQPSHVR